jgi:hypothetical protein
MKRLLPLAALFVVCACAGARAQGDVPGLVDAFGKVNMSDLAARLDNFAIELQNDPSARGLFVVYPRPDRLPGWYMRLAYWGKGYLIKVRGFDASRVEVVNGGYRDEVKYELWALRPGAASPVEPYDWAAALAREKSPVLFDRDVYEEQQGGPAPEGSFGDYTDARDRYEPFVSALRADPAARGYVIAYRTRRAPRGSDRKLAGREKLSLMRLHALGAGRVEAVGGGVRRERTVEFWIVPPGAEPPRPAPEPTGAKRTRAKRR